MNSYDSAGQFVVSLMNLKQQLLTGNLHSNTFYADDENTNSPAQLPRISKVQIGWDIQTPFSTI